MGIGPGNIANSMPPQPDDFARRARDAMRTQREQAAGRSAQAMQFGIGGILVNGGGSITIEGSGSLNVGSGALNSAGSISAGTTITAGGAISGASLSATGAVSAGTSVSGASVASTGAVTGASVTATGNVQGGGLISTGAASISGSLSVGTVASSGQVVSAGPLKSPGSYAYNVHVGSWVAGWIDSDGTLGTSPSSGTVKTDLTAMTADDAAKLLTVTPYWGRYVWDAPDAPLKVFVTAEDVQAAGFGPDVAPVVVGDPMNISADPTNPVMVEAGHSWTVNYSQLVVPLLAVVKQQQAQIDALNARLTAAGIA